jgi:hypothetical protein
LATPNYGYEKRQKELAKKRKKEDKLKAKAERKQDSPESEEGHEGGDLVNEVQQDPSPLA